jgi:glycosyltransferase involved in cell wall biosynthesis
MQVLIVARSFAGAGTATDEHSADLARWIVDAGHHVQVLCSSAAGNQRLRPLRVVNHGVVTNRVWTPGWGRLGSLGKAVDNFCFYPLVILSILLRASRTDRLLVLDTPIPLNWIAPLARLASGGRCKTVCWLLDLMPEKQLLENPGFFMRQVLRISRWFNYYGCRVADLNVVLGECMSRFMQRQCVHPEKIRSIGMWSLGNEITPISPHSSQLRQQWNADENTFVIMYAGYGGLWHHFESVERAIELLKDDPRVQFVFIGSGPHLDRLRRRAATEKWPHLQFNPRMPREMLGEMLGAADAHLVTQNPAYTGLCVPSKLFSAMAAERPVIYVGDPACQTAVDIQDANCGVILPPNDADALVHEIRRLANDPETCRAMGQRAREVMLAEHDLPVRCQQWVEALETLGMPATAHPTEPMLAGDVLDDEVEFLASRR